MRLFRLGLIGLTALLGLAAAAALLAAPGQPATQPRANQQGVPPSTVISATFSEAIAPASVGAGSFVVHSAQRGLVTGTYTLQNLSRTVVLTPASPLWPGDQIQTTITTATTNLSAEAVLSPTVWQFRVAAGPASGDFQGTVTLTTSFGPTGVVAGDFNNDGKPDLAVASTLASTLQTLSSGSVTLYWGDGAGNFTTGPSAAVGLGAIALTSGDFNHDGKLDLATANAGVSGNPGQTVTVLLGDGAGGFSETTYVVGVGPRGISSSDLNGDGFLDLAVTNSGGNNPPPGNTVSILAGDGAGHFSHVLTPTVGPDPGGIVSGDFNADGALDLAVANDDDGTISILTNTGVWNFAISSTVAISGEASNLAAADFNADGNLDLAAASDQAGAVTVLTGAGAGGFTPDTTKNVGSGPETVAAGDIDGDGDIDLVVANTGDGTGATASILFGDGNGDFPLIRTLNTGLGPLGLALADLDGDDDLDLAVTNAGSSTSPGATANVFCNLNGQTCRPPASYGAALKPDRNGSGFPGLTLIYFHTLTNTGSGADSFTFTASSSQGWPLGLPEGQIGLAAGEATQIQVAVVIPTTAVSGTVDTTVVTATSVTSNSSQASAVDVTTVVEAERVYLSLILKP